MKTIQELNTKELNDIKNIEYKYQEQLTQKLDELNENFNQEIINEIILWKVNRYAIIPNVTLNKINQIKKNKNEVSNELIREILKELLEIKGIKLAMASTILRFKNPKIFQIIDQRVYRFIYGKELPSTTKIDKLIEIYIEYLDKLKKVCNEKKVEFEQSDRIFYELDKKYNKEHKLKNY